MRSVVTRLGVASLGLVLALGLTSCSSNSDMRQRVGFAIDAPIVDYNPATVAGFTGGSRAAFSRVLLGFSYLDGLGNRLADTEFGTVSVKLGNPSLVLLTLHPKAVFSDGAPITCDDILFSWIARRPVPGSPFRSMTMPGLADIATVKCSPGTRTAEVVFRSKTLPRDWLGLFGAGTIMPWHVVAHATGVKSIHRLAREEDPDGMRKVAAFWNREWRFDKPSVDIDKFVSAGPYRVEGMDNEGTITLVRNEKWWGEPAIIPRIVIYSATGSIAQHLNDGEIHVGDLAEDGSNPTLPPGFTAATISSQNVLQIRLSTAGAFSAMDVREGFMRCIPREAIQAALFPQDKKRKAEGSPEMLGRLAGSILPLGNDPVVRQVTTWSRLDKRPAPRKQPQRVRVTIAYKSHTTMAERIISMIADKCRPVGFDVIGTPSEGYTGELLSSGAVQAAFLGTAGAVGPGGAFDVASGLVGLGPYIGTDFRFQEDDELFSRALRIDNSQGETLPIHSDGVDHNALYAQSIAYLQEYLWQKGYALPLFVQPRWQFVNSALKGVTQGRSAASVGWNMDRWTVD